MHSLIVYQHQYSHVNYQIIIVLAADLPYDTLIEVYFVTLMPFLSRTIKIVGLGFV